MQKNYGIKFSSIAGALPSKVVKNTDLEKLFETSDEWIYTRTGIRERKIIAENESGLGLSVKAAKEALELAKFDPKDLDLIIVCTTTPDKLYPTMSCMLQGHLGATNAVGFDLSAACSGFIFGLVTASQYMYNGIFKNALIVGVDIHSRFLDWSERSVSILFGDGAAAALITSCLPGDDELLGYQIHSEADKNLDLTLGNENITFDKFEKEINPNFVKMNGKAIYQFALRVVPDIVYKLLDKLHIKPQDLDYFIPHQANQRIIDATSEKIGFKSDQVITNIQNVGNTSAASIPLAIVDGLKAGKIKTSKQMLLVGFGAGLTWGAAVIKPTFKFK